MIERRKRGRIGGYGRTGLFVRNIEYNRWYNTNQIRKFFHERGDFVDRYKAKTVFESLDRGQCYRTRRKVVGSRQSIMLLPTPPSVESVPAHLLRICDSSIQMYLTSWILQSAFSSPLKSIKREYPRNCPELGEHIHLQMNNEPVEIDGALYKIAAWDMLDNKIRVLFKEVDTTH